MNSEQIYTISELNAKARFLLEENFPLIWVEGEISNLSQPSSGHI
jgi:exodeoxyribonuclease VII large subunit